MDVASPEGFELVDLGHGYGVTFGPVYVDRVAHRMGFYVSDMHANPVGTCHGGALATFCDAQIVAFRAGAESGNIHSPTISLSLAYLAPIPLGSWVESHVTLLRQTRTLFFLQSVIFVDGETVAQSTAIYRNPGVQK